MADTWRLKFDRAYKHILDFQFEIARYAMGNPYRGERVPARNRKAEPNIWTYILRVTKQPDERVSLSYGDAIHNLRSALDHIAVGMVPSDRKSHASFPCINNDLWLLDSGGEFVYGDEDRMTFERRVRGMPPEAIALILKMQPYRSAAPNDEALAVLNRLDVADKHRRLIAFVTGVEYPVSQFVVRGFPLGEVTMEGGFVKDGAQLCRLDASRFPGLTDREVEVKVSGAPQVAIHVSEEGGHVEAFKAFTLIARNVEAALSRFEPFVRR